MRAGVLLRAFVPDFRERMVHFDGFDATSQFKAEMRDISPTATVPALCDHARTDSTGRPLVVWDTLAIVEYIAEYCAHSPVWPRDAIARAQARSLCAEMHSGFGHLRACCPMNIGPDLGQQGAIFGGITKGCDMTWRGLTQPGAIYGIDIRARFYAVTLARLTPTLALWSSGWRPMIYRFLRHVAIIWRR